MFACLIAPVLACSGDRLPNQSLSTTFSVSQSADNVCEIAIDQPATQIARWNVKTEFLSRSLVAVLHQHGLSVINHPAGSLHREFSRPSLFDMGIALRL
jgi:hypothetical protein